MSNQAVLTEDEVKDLRALTSQLREMAEKGVKPEALEAINVKIDKFEEKNQQALAERKALENANRDLTEKITALDKLISKQSSGSDKKDYKESAEYKALNNLVRKGVENLNPEEQKALRTDVGSDGGFLVPETLANVILKQIEEISPVRAFARKWTIPGKSLSVPVRSGIPSAPYEGEAEEGSESGSSYKSENLQAFRQSATIGITQDLLSFAGFNMESELLADARLSFAKTEGEKMVKGTGVKEPEGFAANAAVQAAALVSASSGVIDLDDVIKLSGELKQGYSPIYGFNRGTLVHLRTLKDSNGNYLWQIGGTTQPMQINGYDYAILQDMDAHSAGAGAFPVVFADFYAGYSIFDSIQMAIIRDNVTKKKQAMVEFTVHRWNTGQVVLAEAIKLLKIKA